MERRRKNWYRGSMHMILWLMLVAAGLACSSHKTYAQTTGMIPGYVKTVSGEAEMVQSIVDGMRSRHRTFAFYYPGIERTFAAYAREGGYGCALLDRIWQRDSYYAGTVTNCCVYMAGRRQRYVVIRFQYLTTRAQEQWMDRNAAGIAAGIGQGDPAVRAAKAHDYLLRQLSYDTRAGSPYYAFTKGKGTCVAYALTYQKILRAMGIPCIYVTGKEHAWNLVKLGNYWYSVDVTWDDAEGSRRYLFRSDYGVRGHRRLHEQRYRGIRMAPVSYTMSYGYR